VSSTIGTGGRPHSGNCTRLGFAEGARSLFSNFCTGYSSRADLQPFPLPGKSIIMSVIEEKPGLPGGF
jgi:hypothetical protein